MKTNKILKTIALALILILTANAQKTQASCMPKGAEIIAYKVYTGLTVEFYPGITIDPSTHSWVWKFGDGNTSTLSSPQNTYKGEGRYTVRLVFTEIGTGCKDSVEKCVSVFDPTCTATKLAAHKYKFSPNTSFTSGLRITWEFFGDSTFEKRIFTRIFNHSNEVYYTVTYFDSLCDNLDSFSFSGKLANGKCGFSRPQYKPYISCNDSLSNPNMAEIQFYASTYTENNVGNLFLNMDWGNGTTSQVYSNNYNNYHQSNFIKSLARGASYALSLKITDTLNLCSDTFNYQIDIDTMLFPKIQKSLSGNVLTLQTTSNGTLQNWYITDQGSTYSVTGNPATYTLKSRMTHNITLIMHNKNLCMEYAYGSIFGGTNNYCNASFVKYGDSTKSFYMNVYNNSTGKRYHWDFGDGDTSNFQYPMHTYSGLGPYNLCLTVYDTNCSSTYCDSVGFNSSGIMNRGQGFTMEVKNPNGTASVKSAPAKIKARIVPNPADTKIVIAAAGIGNETLLMYAMDGKLVKINKVNSTSDTVTLDISNLSNGIYIVNAPKLGVQEKVIVKH